MSGRVYDDRYRIIVSRNDLIFYRYEEPDDKVVIVRSTDSRRDVERVR